MCDWLIRLSVPLLYSASMIVVTPLSVIVDSVEVMTPDTVSPVLSVRDPFCVRSMLPKELPPWLLLKILLVIVRCLMSDPAVISSRLLWVPFWSVRRKSVRFMIPFQ